MAYVAQFQVFSCGAVNKLPLFAAFRPIDLLVPFWVVLGPHTKKWMLFQHVLGHFRLCHHLVFCDPADPEIPPSPLPGIFPKPPSLLSDHNLSTGRIKQDLVNKGCFSITRESFLLALGGAAHPPFSNTEFCSEREKKQGI